MKQARFEELVERLEQSARVDPRGYRFRVLMLAILGYAYIGMVLAVVLGLTGFLAWWLLTGRGGGALVVKLGIPAATLVFIVVRAMWVRLDPPAGRTLLRAEAPKLFAAAENLARALKAPMSDVVLVTSDLNASVSQVPRLGIFGWRTNYLVVGLPLASALHPDLFRAVLAHEFAHLSRAHSHFSGWIYRLRMTWSQLVRMLEQEQHIGSVVFSRFFKWYAPYFAAYSFVLAREYEYEADQLAASVTSPRDMAAALLVLDTKHRELEETYWPTLWEKAETDPDVPPAPISDLLTAAAARSASDQAMVRTYIALQGRAGTADTHPSLRDRMTALLAAEPVLPDESPEMRLVRLAFDRGRPWEDPPVRAAPLYFGGRLGHLAATMDAEWRDAARSNWRARNQYCREARATLEALDTRALAGPLPSNDLWQRAQLTEEFRSLEAAEPIYREMVERHPEHAGPRLVLGRALVHRLEPSGVAEIEQAMQLDPDLVFAGTDLVTDYYTRMGMPDEAQQYRRRMLDRQDEVAEGQQERASIGPRTKFESPELPAEAVAGLVAQLASHADLTGAWLVRQVVTAMPEQPAHVLVLNLEGSGLSENAQAERGATIAKGLSLPAGVNAFVLGKPQADLMKKIRRVPGSLIHTAGRERPGALAKVRSWIGAPAAGGR